MSSKDKMKGNISCTGRDIKALQDYVKDGSLPKGFLANMLNKSGLLREFEAVPKSNECEFSFPKSDWFGVYITDTDGNFFLDPRTGEDTEGIMYFRIKTVGSVPSIDTDSVTFTRPAELNNIKPCIIENGKCAVPKETKEVKPRQPRAAKSTGSPAGTVSAAAVTPAIEQMIESLQVGVKAAQPKMNIPREELEKMDHNTLINWVSQHMYPEDLNNCVRSGNNITPDDLSILGDIESTNTDMSAMRAAANMEPSMVQKMFSSISRTDIINRVNKQANKKDAIIRLCNDAGLNYTLANSRTGPIIKDIYGETITDDKALSECASVSAIRARNILAQQMQTARSRARKITAGKYPEYQGARQGPSGTSSSQGPSQGPSREQILVDDMIGAMEEGDLDYIAEIANVVGLDVSVINGKLYTGDVPIPDDDILDFITEIAHSHTIRFKSGFGYRRRKRKTCKKPMKRSKVISNFKLAVKKCKGGKNYRSCMKKTLRQMYKRKSSFGKAISLRRKSPRASATLYRVGTIKKGIDGKMWVVKKTVKGVKRWVKKSYKK